MSPASDILSPLAAPFYPSHMDYDGEFSLLYCDGVPVSVMNEHEVMANVADEVIDQMFPLSAIDAAEMDAIDDFLQMLVNLSLIEEREEKARSNLGLVTSKRWEAKRKEGVKGKPHLSHGRIERVHHENIKLNMHEHKVIPHARHSLLTPHEKCSSLGASRFHNKAHNDLKRNKFVHQYTKCIQQPRKQN